MYKHTDVHVNQEVQEYNLWTEAIHNVSGSLCAYQELTTIFSLHVIHEFVVQGFDVALATLKLLL